MTEKAKSERNTVKKKMFAALFAACALMAAPAFAAKDPTSQVLEELRKINPSVPVDAVSKTDMDGIYEVVSNGQVFYFHLKTKTVILGNMIRDGRSLTMQRQAELQALLLKGIPLDKAVKVGNGPNEVIAFSDPDCPFCRKAEDWLKTRTDITMYVFLFPLPMHPDAPKKSRNILCAKDQGAVYRETMEGKWDKNFELPKGCEEKAAPLLDVHMKWGQKVGVRGTPAFWVNGVGVPGADVQRIESLLTKGAPKQGGPAAPAKK